MVNRTTMSCDKLPRVTKAEDQSTLDYWWKRHNTVVELLHEREDMLRWACHFIHRKETCHAIVRGKKRWACEDCQLDFRAIDLDNILLSSQTPYHYPDEREDCPNKDFVYDGVNVHQFFDDALGCTSCQPNRTRPPEEA